MKFRTKVTFELVEGILIPCIRKYLYMLSCFYNAIVVPQKCYYTTSLDSLFTTTPLPEVPTKSFTHLSFSREISSNAVT
jgi:hypothetical protein